MSLDKLFLIAKYRASTRREALGLVIIHRGADQFIQHQIDERTEMLTDRRMHDPPLSLNSARISMETRIETLRSCQATIRMIQALLAHGQVGLWTLADTSDVAAQRSNTGLAAFCRATA